VYAHSCGQKAPASPFTLCAGPRWHRRARAATDQVSPPRLQSLTESSDLVEGDEAGGQAGEGGVDVGTPLVADAQSAEAVEPNEGAFHHPAVAPEPLATLDALARDAGDDPAGPALPALGLGVVAPVGVQFVRRRRGRPRRLRTGGMASMVGAGIRVSWRLAPVSRKPSGVPRASTTRLRFVPGLPRSVVSGPVAGLLFASTHALWRQARR